MNYLQMQFIKRRKTKVMRRTLLICRRNKACQMFACVCVCAFSMYIHTYTLTQPLESIQSIHALFLQAQLYIFLYLIVFIFSGVSVVILVCIYFVFFITITNSSIGIISPSKGCYPKCVMCHILSHSSCPSITKWVRCLSLFVVAVRLTVQDCQVAVPLRLGLSPVPLKLFHRQLVNSFSDCFSQGQQVIKSK